MEKYWKPTCRIGYNNEEKVLIWNSLNDCPTFVSDAQVVVIVLPFFRGPPYEKLSTFYGH